MAGGFGAGEVPGNGWKHDGNTGCDGIWDVAGECGDGRAAGTGTDCHRWWYDGDGTR